MLVDKFRVNSPNVSYTEEAILSKYEYQTTSVSVVDGEAIITPMTRSFEFKTETRVPRLGLMLVGLGGNNGTTVAAGIIANREGISWRTKSGVQAPNYFGSLSQASTIRVGECGGEEIYVPFNGLLPMVNPNDVIVGGWDISGTNMADAMERAQVLEFDLQRQLVPYMRDMRPLPSVYYPDFIAANQADRADNVIPGSDKMAHVEQIRKDIRDFKAANKVDKVIILWTANTERFCDVLPGLNDTADNLMASITRSEAEVSPSTVFAVASILEGVAFINGSPQNTLVPGVVELALRHKVYIAGDDFKSGQTKMKSVLVDFLVGAGIKPTSIVSYNHLGNNDGKNLSAPQQFRSKEISKSNVVDDMVGSNAILYKPSEHPDHVVVIKYVPYVADSKRAMDEYTSEIFMGGRNTIVMHNTCEDSLLAAPIILDLVLFTELMQRITFRESPEAEFEGFHSVLSVLSYFLKAPLVPSGTPIVNALAKQRSCIENIMRACVGLTAEHNMQIEHRMLSAGSSSASSSSE